MLAPDVARSVSGPYLAACALLAIAGVGKVLHPAPTRSAVNAIGLWVPNVGVVAFGIFEVAAGGVGARFGGRAAIGVAAGYLLLTVFALALLLRAPTTPCACFGSTGSVVTRAHVAINVLALSISILAVAGGSPLARLSGHWVASAAFVVLVACCVKLAALTLEELPRLTAAMRDARR